MGRHSRNVSGSFKVQAENMTLHYISCFCAEIFYLFFYFKHVIIAHGSIFMIAVLKALSGNFKISVISSLVSVNYLFSLKLKFFWFLVEQVSFSCILDIWNLML